METVDYQASEITWSVIKLRLISRFELVVWSGILIPYAGLLPFFMFVHPIFIFAIPIYIIFLILAAIPIEFILNLFRVKSTALPEWSRNDFDQLFAEMRSRGAISWNSDRVRYIENDLSCGAQVRGILRPTIIVSAGLLIAVKRRDLLAKAILAHELAHIAHFDRLTISNYALWVANLLSPFYLDGAKPSSPLGGWEITWLWGSLASLALCGFFSRRRELAADASGVILAGNDVYSKLMSSAVGTHARNVGTFFHPSMSTRWKSAMANPVGPLSLNKYAICIYLSIVVICFIGGGFMDGIRGNITGDFFITLGWTITAGFGLLIEILRPSKPIPLDRNSIILGDEV